MPPLFARVAGQTQAYQQRAGAFLGPQRITDPATRPVLAALNTLRAMPAGYANPHPQPVYEDLGLSRRDTLRGAAVQAYSDSLEQLLRPRMMLQVENDLAQYLADDRKIDAYRALKVYILLAKAQDGREDDLAIQSYFAQSWAGDYAGADAEYRAINAHLAAMLELDSRVTPLVGANAALIERVREAIADVPPAARAYGAIRSQAGTLPAWRLAEALPGAAFATREGRPVATLSVPGLFTFEGYWGFFEGAVADAALQLEADAWVLGAADAQPLLSDAELSQEVHAIYARDFQRVWSVMLDRLALAAPGADLALLADPGASPLVALAAVVDRETRLSDFASKALENNGNFVPDGDMLAQAALVERPFADWHALLEGPQGARPMDAVLAALARAEEVAAGGQGALSALSDPQAGVPAPMVALMGQVRDALAPAFVDAQLVALDRERCGLGAPPVGQGFGAVFGYGGQMEGLAASVPGPVSPRAAARLAAADAVRAAFFTPGIAGPVVPFRVQVVAVRPEISPITLGLGARVLTLQSGGPAVPAVWTSAAPITLAVPDQPALAMVGGDWSVLTFLSGQSLQVRGPLVQVAHRLGPYTATFRLEFEGTDVPFLSEAFEEIMCTNAMK